MHESEQPNVPIWAAARAQKHNDILREVARSLDTTERERALRPLDKLTERDLEAEQLRLEEWLHLGTITVESFRRLREVDFYLEAMQQRRGFGPAREEWQRESQSE